MHRFRGADADQYPQDFNAAGPLRHSWVKTIAALLDGWKVKACCVRNGLKKIGIGSVVVGPRNGCVLADGKRRYRLRERKVRIEIRIVITAAVARPPTRVERELH